MIRQTKRQDDAPCCSNGRYIWKKEWVRPYESSFSVVKNFCKVNVLSGSEAFKILRSGGTDQNVWRRILPKWHVAQAGRVVYPEKLIGNSIPYKLHYCPVCMEENYHSVFHDMPGIKTCPYHHIPLLTTDRSPDPINIAYDICSSACEAYNAAAAGILPTERRVPASFYLNVRYNRYSLIIPASTVLHPELNLENIMLGDISPAVIMSSPTYKFDDRTLQKKFTQWFIRQKIPVDLMHPNGRTISIDNDLLNGGIVSLLLYYKTWELYSRHRSLIDLASLKGFMAAGEYDVVIDPRDTSKLFLSFVWAMIDCGAPRTALTSRYIFHPNGCEMYGRHLPGISLRNMLRYPHGKDASVKIALLKAAGDCFDSFWNQYYNIAMQNDGIHFRDGWKLLKPPLYYVLRQPADEQYTIVRYDG